MRIVMIRGERDRFTPAEGRLQYEGLLLDGFERVTFLVAPGIGHNHVNAAWFEKGITALDHAELRKPPTTAPTSQPHPQVGQIAQAQRLFVTARLWHISPGPLDAGRGEARRYLKQLLDDYPTTPAAKQAREMLKMLDAEAATPRTAKPASRPLQATTRP